MVVNKARTVQQRLVETYEGLDLACKRLGDVNISKPHAVQQLCVVLDGLEQTRAKLALVMEAVVPEGVER